LILPLAMTCGRWVTAVAAAIFCYFIMALRLIRHVQISLEVNSSHLMDLKLGAGIFSWKQQVFRGHARVILLKLSRLFSASH
jgi:hypothetical protein